MNQERIFITGANGQLGLALQAKYPGAQAGDSDVLDITDITSLQAFDWSNTDIILNAAAYTNVDGAETAEGRQIAWKVNAQAVANLTKIAMDNDITLVHLSTDYVFDGTKKEHDELEEYTPINVYGQTKAAGDIAISLAPKHYILRTSWVIGDGKNFVRTMLGLAERGINPAVVSDQVGRPTFTAELVGAIDHLLTTSSSFGTYNVTNSGEPVSWADLTRQIFTIAGYSNTVTDTTTADYYAGKEGIAPRPLNSVLLLNKLQATGYQPTAWQDGLKAYIEKEKN